MDGVSSATASGPDGKEPLVMVLGATNYPWKIDEALRRRLEKRVYIPLPEEATITKLLELNLKEVQISADVDLQTLAKNLVGYSGADITNVCRDAAMMPMRRRIQGLSPDEIKIIPKDELKLPVTAEDFKIALSKIQSSVSKEDIEKYVQWMKNFGSS
jgi:katanin p60 ATPase-containing subunit A1